LVYVADEDNNRKERRGGITKEKNRGEENRGESKGKQK
jgi:hypothetical protein